MGRNKKKIILAVILVAVLVAAYFMFFGKSEETKPTAGKQENVQSVEIGEYITFGQYEQDGDETNGKEDVEWLVLDKQDGKVLVISRYALDCMPYHKTTEDVTWETGAVRAYLNNTFTDEAFSADEKNKIQTVTVEAHENPCKEPYHESTPGNATKDKVFLLSITEVETYLKADERSVVPTEYAKARVRGQT